MAATENAYVGGRWTRCTRLMRGSSGRRWDAVRAGGKAFEDAQDTMRGKISPSLHIAIRREVWTITYPLTLIRVFSLAQG